MLIPILLSNVIFVSFVDRQNLLQKFVDYFDAEIHNELETSQRLVRHVSMH